MVAKAVARTFAGGKDISKHYLSGCIGQGPGGHFQDGGNDQPNWFRRAHPSKGCQDFEILNPLDSEGEIPERLVSQSPYEWAALHDSASKQRKDGPF